MAVFHSKPRDEVLAPLFWLERKRQAPRSGGFVGAIGAAGVWQRAAGGSADRGAQACRWHQWGGRSEQERDSSCGELGDEKGQAVMTQAVMALGKRKAFRERAHHVV